MPAGKAERRGAGGEGSGGELFERGVLEGNGTGRELKPEGVHVKGEGPGR